MRLVSMGQAWRLQAGAESCNHASLQGTVRARRVRAGRVPRGRRPPLGWARSLCCFRTESSCQ